MAKLPENAGDDVLVGLILDGDGDAFTRLLERYHGRVFRLVRGILGDWHRSEDVCQEIFTTVFRKLSGFRGRSGFSTWLYRIAVNAALKARKRDRRRRAESIDAALAFMSQDDPRPARIEGEEVFRKLLAPLPEKLRVVVVLRDQVGLNYAEMARVLGCSRGAVEQRIHRAMVTLREIWAGKQELP